MLKVMNLSTEFMLIMLILLVIFCYLFVRPIIFTKDRADILKLLSYPLIWIILCLSKNKSLQSHLCVWLFLNPQIVIWIYLVLIRICLVLLLSYEFSIINIVNEDTIELCSVVQAPSVKKEFEVTLFSSLEESDFWAQKQKYTIHKAYLDYLSYENSRNRFYNRTFNNSFDDSVWAERSFSNFISYSFNKYSWNIHNNNLASAEVVLGAKLEGLNDQETHSHSKSVSSTLLLLEGTFDNNLINIDFKKLALVLVDYFWVTKFKYVNFDINHLDSCFLNTALKKSLSKHFTDIDWNSASTWTLIFGKFQEKLFARSHNLPFKDVLINSKVVTEAEVQTWMTNERARLFSESLANADIGPNNIYDDGLDDEFR